MKIWKLGQNALAAASKQQRQGFRQVDAEPVQLTGLSNDKSGIWNSLSSWSLRQSRS
ncbi:hypothetical protein HanXRQr2_Chr14g0656101 [Helianthus annuus]|uniref:Uncharacterized protein n=1 Tax=Helianthus annuus TaxID=4232 RepID=A0A251SJJ0_HELAN|nr:hypothetical protein HanXRQr2_Chr14g0656101 [Helianthus annuus]KAJ0469796.1 hypothetical protein HanIR_Chr14g0711801 [Helianthus annuus]